MDEPKLKALLSLLDDTDQEVVNHVKEKLLSLGEDVIPVLEKEWEANFSPLVQERIENLIHQMQYVSLRDRLKAWKQNEQENLLKGLWIISTYQYPDLDYAQLKAQFEQLYYEAWIEYKETSSAIDEIQTLNYIFFRVMKFSPNTKNFHSPGNSMINIVLESKKGNPISLCVIYMLIAQRMKIPLHGVNLPNLFVLMYKNEMDQFYINVFNKGLIFSRADIDNYIKQLKLSPKDSYYEPCENLDIMIRIMRNLTICFEKLGETDKIQEVQELLDILIHE